MMLDKRNRFEMGKMQGGQIEDDLTTAVAKWKLGTVQ
jgi:hypothetical protein